MNSFANSPRLPKGAILGLDPFNPLASAIVFQYLNPIDANVSLDLNVLSYHDLGLLSPGGGLFMALQSIKEGIAAFNVVGAAVSSVENFRASASFGG